MRHGQRRSLLAVMAAALALALARPAQADIIDYNPITTAPPQILAPSEIQKYEQLLRSAARPAIVTAGAVPGRHVLIREGNQYKVLDTLSEASSNFDLGLVTSFGTLVWSGPTSLVAYGVYDRQPAKLVFDLAAGRASGTPFTLPTLPGKRLNITGGLIQTADGAYHVLGYTVTTGSQVQVWERPSFDPRGREELEVLDQAEPLALLAPNDEQVVAINLDSGALTTIGTVPAGSNVALAASSVVLRPGSNTAAYIIAEEIPWRGEVRSGRANRGGFMPTGYYNTQENLGLIPEAENRWLTGRRLALVDLGDTDAATVIENADHPGGMFLNPMWTGDGRYLVVRTAIPSLLEGRPHPIYEYNAGSFLRLFTPEGSFLAEWRREGMDGGAAFGPTTDSLMLVVNRENMSRSVYFVDLTEPDKAPLKVYDGDDQVYLFNFALAGDKVLALRGDVTDYGDLFIGDTGKPNSQMRRLTDSNPALRELSNIKFEPVTYTTSSGFTVTGIYIYPGHLPYPPPQPLPVVVWQQGGPGGQMTNTWGTSVEDPYSLLPNFGLPVFMVNGAGRTSNGAAFYSAMADAGNFGMRDILDVKEGVDFLVQQGVVDPAKVAVTGCSYGGYFALQSVVKLPDYYATANAQCSLNDLQWEYNFGWTPFLAYLMGRSTTADPAEYIDDSPPYGAYKITTPLLLFHGTNDFLPFEHITNIHDQVDAKGTPVRFLRAYNRGHGFGNVQGDPQGVPTGARTQNFAFQLQLSWFREHLKLPAPRFTLSLPGLEPQPIGRLGH